MCVCIYIYAPEHPAFSESDPWAVQFEYLWYMVLLPQGFYEESLEK